MAMSHRVSMPFAIGTMLRSIYPSTPYTHLRMSSTAFKIPPFIPAFSITIPGIISDIWEGLLRAVPKKKTSHMKKRHRQLAGKALKDVNAVNSCPGCGKPKKAHTLCPFCVAEIQQSWKQAAKLAFEGGTFP